MFVGVVQQGEVDMVGPQTGEALVERSSNPVGREIEHRSHRRDAVEDGVGVDAGNEHATHLGGDRQFCAGDRAAAHRCTQARFCKTVPVLRCRVEVPNALDHDWGIDVTKSRALPPAALRDDLRKIGERTRSDAKRVYSHRGAKLTPKADEDRVLLWEPVARHDKTFYRLNRLHPLLKQVIAANSNRAALNALFRLIEETIPFPHITIENSEKPNQISGLFEHIAESQIREVMEQAFESLVASGYGANDAVNRLRTIWPFELFPALLQSLSESKNHA